MCLRMLGIALSLLVAPWLLAPAPPEPPPAAAIVAELRHAAGHGNLKRWHGLHLVGTARTHGVDLDYQLYLAHGGRFHASSRGELNETRGSDGALFWIRDYSQTTRRLDLRDREVSLVTYSVLTGHWTHPDAPLDIALAPDQPDPKFVEFIVRPKNGVLKTTLKVERLTGKVQRLSYVGRSGDVVWTYSEHKDIQGVRLPMRWEMTSQGLTNSVRIREGKAVARAELPSFGFVYRPCAAASFDAAKPPALAVKRARTGHLLVHPTVQGKDLGWFILDSGAGMTVIDRAMADQMDLPAFGEINAVGVGGAVKTRMRKCEQLELGPLTLKNPVLLELDLAAIGRAVGVPLAGIVGYQIFQAGVVEIDTTAPAVNLRDPTRFELTGDGRWQELFIDGNHPIVKGRIPPDEAGYFRLDTGAANTVSFNSPVVERLKLADGKNLGAARIEGGVGGFQRSQAGRLDWLELAGRRFEKPSVTFSLAKTGAFADEHLMGNVGTGLLGRFIIVFDYGSQRVALQRKPVAQR